MGCEIDVGVCDCTETYMSDYYDRLTVIGRVVRRIS